MIRLGVDRVLGGRNTVSSKGPEGDDSEWGLGGDSKSPGLVLVFTPGVLYGEERVGIEDRVGHSQ